MFTPWFTQSQQMAEPVQRMVKEQLAQMERFAAMAAEAQRLGFERAAAAIDESGKLAKSSLVYAEELGKHWRETALAAAKQAMTGFPGAL